MSKTTDNTEAPPSAANGELLSRVKATLATGITQAELARRCGISQAALSTWLRNIYTGSNEQLEAAILRFYEQEDYSRTKHELIVTDPPYYPMPTSERIWPVLRYNHLRGGMAAIVGAPGLGKSSTYEEYRRIYPNVWRIIATEASGSVSALLLAICDALGILLTGKSKAAIERAILDKLSRANGLIIIDEAQYLDKACLYELAGLREKAIAADPEQRGLGIVVSGNEQVWRTIKSAYAQLFSRFNAPLILSNVRKGDIDASIDAWARHLNLPSCPPSMRAKLHAIGNEPGALRNITETFRFAAFLAAGAQQPVDEAMISAAWEAIGKR